MKVRVSTKVLHGMSKSEVRVRLKVYPASRPMEFHLLRHSDLPSSTSIVNIPDFNSALYQIWMLDYDRCASLEGIDDVENHLASVLGRNDSTVPKARPSEEGYKSFKAGYVKTAHKYGSKSRETCRKVLLILEANLATREKRNLGRSEGSGEVGAGVKY